jgi:hypothetical protein
MYLEYKAAFRNKKSSEHEECLVVKLSPISLHVPFPYCYVTLLENTLKRSTIHYSSFKRPFSSYFATWRSRAVRMYTKETTLRDFTPYTDVANSRANVTNMCVDCKDWWC